MPDKDAMEIKISKVIPTHKWKVIRLVTKVWEFPSYVPTVKEVSVIQKNRNNIKTRWHIQTSNIPIKWVELDTLMLDKNAIYFKAIEGDLQEFEGEWIFSDHPEGTEVTVNVRLKVDIPAIKDFAENYIKNIVTKNFEAILESIEHRLVSVRYSSYKRGDIEKIAGFGLIGHFYNIKHLERCLKMLNPDFKVPSQEFLSQLFNVTPSFKLYDILNFSSRAGQTVNGCFILATFIPDMIERDMWAVFSKVVRACKIAEKAGIGIVALAGFASIVGERVGQAITDEVDVPVTTGNAFTAAMVIDGVLKAVELLNVDINSTKAVIVGGAGDIGSACARVLTDKVKQLTITGRTKERLSQIKAELAKKHKAGIIAMTDNEAAVRDADIVIAAASTSASILNIDWFKPGAIICDAGYPKNAPYVPLTREDILIFSGGLAKSPTPITFPIDLGLPCADIIYGCFAEGIILALEKRYESFSFGKGKIIPEKIEEIRNLGKRHGFEVSDFYWCNKLIDESAIEKIRQTIKDKTVDAVKKA